MWFRGIRDCPNRPESFTGPVSAPVNVVERPDIASHALRRDCSLEQPREAEISAF